MDFLDFHFHFRAFLGFIITGTGLPPGVVIVLPGWDGMGWDDSNF